MEVTFADALELSHTYYWGSLCDWFPYTYLFPQYEIQ